MRTLFSFLIFQTLVSALVAWRAFATGMPVTGAAMAAIGLLCVLLLALFVSAPGRAARSCGLGRQENRNPENAGPEKFLRSCLPKQKKGGGK